MSILRAKSYAIFYSLKIYIYNATEVIHEELFPLWRSRKNTVNSKLIQNPAVTIPAIISFS